MILWCVGVFVLLAVYFLGISRVTSNAMMPALAQGDVVLSFAPVWMPMEYSPGKIVKVRSVREDIAPNFLRVLGVPGHHVSYDSDKIEIDQVPLKRRILTNDAIVRTMEEPEIWQEMLGNKVYRITLPRQPLVGKLRGDLDLDSESYFLVGDNRAASYDSRQAGATKAGDIRGFPLIILYSSRNDGILGHFIKPVSE